MFVRKSPFKSQIEATAQMVNLLSREAEAQGTPLSEDERKLLSSDAEGGICLSEDFRLRIIGLVESLVRQQRVLESNDKQNSFLAAFEWASDAYSPQIVVLTWQVIDSGVLGPPPKLHGRKWLKDKVQLVGCGLLVVLFMLLVVVLIAFVFDRK
jgi:hypothetical protein